MSKTEVRTFTLLKGPPADERANLPEPRGLASAVENHLLEKRKGEAAMEAESEMLETRCDKSGRLTPRPSTSDPRRARDGRQSSVQPSNLQGCPGKTLEEAQNKSGEEQEKNKLDITKIIHHQHRFCDHCCKNFC